MKTTALCNLPTFRHIQVKISPQWWKPRKIADSVWRSRIRVLVKHVKEERYEFVYVCVCVKKLRANWFIKFHPPTFPSWHYWPALYCCCLEQRLPETIPRKQKTFLPIFEKSLYSLTNDKWNTQVLQHYVLYTYVAIFTFCSSLPPTAFSLCVLQGSVCSDCLYGCCCYPLSWLQISRELKRRAASHASSSSSSASYTLLDSLQRAHLV